MRASLLGFLPLYSSSSWPPRVRRSLVVPARFVQNEPLPNDVRSGRPGDVGGRFVAAQDAGRERRVQVRGQLRKRRREMGDGVADRSRHVETRLLRGRAGPPRLAAEARRPRELLEERLALGAALLVTRVVVLGFGVVELLVQIGEALSVLPEGFAIEHGPGVANRNRILCRCDDERERE